MDDDDDLWGPLLVVEEDTSRKPLRGCEFWFDCRTDVLEENFQNERYCELVWRILNQKNQDVEIDELKNDMASSRTGDSRHIGSSDSVRVRENMYLSLKHILPVMFWRVKVSQWKIFWRLLKENLGITN